LPLNVPQIISHGKRADAIVKLVGFLPPLLDDIVQQLLVEITVVFAGETESDHGAFTRRHAITLTKVVPSSAFGS
ncbi:hypothetical protein KCU88_g231, partial [Aureobasidium melanogenum]